MDYTIHLCELAEAEDYARHLFFHLTEKGIGGIYVHPFPSSYRASYDERLANLLIRMSVEPFSPNWEISWVAKIEGKIVGHLNLKTGQLTSMTHRMKLGMGIETPFRSLGIGKQLLKTALTWAKQQKEIDWIDLSVFSNNSAAKALYLKNGFEVQYIVRDAFRLDGEVIDDIQMTVKLK